MIYEAVSLLLLSLSVVFSILAVEANSLYRSIFGLFGMTASIGVLFILMAAYYAGIAQLLIYAGGLIALMLIIVSLTVGKEK
ncbi:MAG: NADH-quinone oxidoreductase subunit J [Nitrososphaerota archaeon]